MRDRLKYGALGFVTACAAAHPRFAEDTDFAWDEMNRALAGQWRATTADHKTIQTSYRSVSRGSALVETFVTANGTETLSVYHRDGHSLMLTHYCGQGNQARLKATTATRDNVVFDFLDATNVTPTQGVMKKLTFAFRPDGFDQESIYREPTGALETTMLHFARAAAPDPHDSESVPRCDVACAAGSFCMNTEKGTRCMTPPVQASLPTFALPFDAQTEVACTHGSGLGSHSWPNAFFALDLANDYSEPAATVRAAADGTAYVFGAEDGGVCPEPPGAPGNAQSTDCGHSWGNRVKVHHGGGIVTFYVHLDHALVRTGDRVRAGDPIGIEGWTGAAGHRHLHFSVQRIPGSTLADWDAHMDWAGESIPFHVRARQGQDVKDIDVATLHCAHAGRSRACLGAAEIARRAMSASFGQPLWEDEAMRSWRCVGPRVAPFGECVSHRRPHPTTQGTRLGAERRSSRRCRRQRLTRTATITVGDA